VTLVESHPVALEQLHAARAKLDATQVEIIAGEAMAAIRRWPSASLDLVLLDPPFDSSLGPAALGAARRVLDVGGFVYYEAAAPLAQGAIDEVGLTLVRAGVAGRVAFHLLGRATA
ncbi:MAG: RsmD family RNA methyltransferase, partial [Burkholderiaceae bacterium]